jgi:hypothetical protein
MPTSDLSARLVIRHKVASNRINPIEQALYTKLKINNYSPSCLSIPEQNDICDIIDRHVGIMYLIECNSVKDLIKSLNLGKGYYARFVKSKIVIQKSLNMFKIFAQLSERNIEIDLNLAERFCTIWNESIDKQFAKIQINDQNKTYICAAAALVYTLHFKCNNSEEKLKQIIDIVIDSANRMQTFTYKKGNIYDILVGKILFNKKFDSIFNVQNAIQFRMNYFYKGSNHDVLFNGKFKKLFINIFFSNNPLRGEEIFTNNKQQLSKWFDSVSAEFDTKKPLRDTCRLKLIGKNENINSLLEEYFIFLTTQKSNPLPTDLIKEGWWSSFVDHVRYTYGYSDFWKIKIKTKS